MLFLIFKDPFTEVSHHFMIDTSRDQYAYALNNCDVSLHVT